MKVNVQDMNGVNYEITGLQETDTLEKLKRLVQLKSRVPVEEQNLMFMGQMLDNPNSTLSSLGIEDGNKVCMVYRHVGGMKAPAAAMKMKMKTAVFSGWKISG